MEKYVVLMEIGVGSVVVIIAWLVTSQLKNIGESLKELKARTCTITDQLKETLLVSVSQDGELKQLGQRIDWLSHEVHDHEERLRVIERP